MQSHPAILHPKWWILHLLCSCWILVDTFYWKPIFLSFSANRLSKNIQNFISSDLKQNKILKLFKALKGLGSYCVEFTQSWNFLWKIVKRMFSIVQQYSLVSFRGLRHKATYRDWAFVYFIETEHSVGHAACHARS